MYPALKTGEHVFALHPDGRYHPAMVNETREIYSGEGTISIYACGFLNDNDKYTGLDDPSSRVENLRQYEILKVAMLPVNHNVIVKKTSSSSRKCLFIKAKLIKTNYKEFASGKADSIIFLVKCSEEGHSKDIE